jgi:hypothetical protein
MDPLLDCPGDCLDPDRPGDCLALEDRTFEARPGIVLFPASCPHCRAPVHVLPGAPWLPFANRGGLWVVHPCALDLERIRRAQARGPHRSSRPRRAPLRRRRPF